MSIPAPLQPAIHRVIHYAPFLAHLMLALHWEMDTSIDTACTNGELVRVNPHFFEGLDAEEQASLMAHEALHCALRHNQRGARIIQSSADARKFNIAADIVVNGALERAGMILSNGWIRNRKLEHLSVETVFYILKDQPVPRSMPSQIGVHCRDLAGPPNPLGSKDTSGPSNSIDWKAIIRQAEIVCRMHHGHGSRPLNIQRELAAALDTPTVDWRSVLWRFLAARPNDWRGWDRRAIWEQRYVPTLDGSRFRAILGIDISGSVSRALLRTFFSEVQGILQIVEDLEIDLYWTDTAIRGPVTLNAQSDVQALRPRGGGGTNLAPLFERAAEIAAIESQSPLPVIYLTDGFGPTLRQEPTGLDTLWVIPQGGDAQKPFGEVVTLETTR